MLQHLVATSDGSTPYVLKWTARKRCTLQAAACRNDTDLCLMSIAIAQPKTESASGTVCGIKQGTSTAAQLDIGWTGAIDLERDEEVWFIFTNSDNLDELRASLVVNYDR